MGLFIVLLISCSEPEVIPPEMIMVEGGSYTMGDDDFFENNPNVENLPHSMTSSIERGVRVKSFYLASVETSRLLFGQFIQETEYQTTAEQDSKWAGHLWESERGWYQTDSGNWRNISSEQQDNHPVVMISWIDAIHFCNWLSQRQGFEPYYDISQGKIAQNIEANGYRLPSSAEWELAARGGLGDQPWTVDLSSVGQYAWYVFNSGMSTHSLASKQSNPLGFYDILGNVSEFCDDQIIWQGLEGYDPSPNIGESLTRGGSFAAIPEMCNYVQEMYAWRYYSSFDTGFRIARNAE